MTKRFAVHYTDAARDDLVRLAGLLLDRAQTADGLEAVQGAIDAVARAAEAQLSRSPFSYRKAGDSPFLRELVTPCRGAGYVSLCEIEGASKVDILAVRHQLEDDQC